MQSLKETEDGRWKDVLFVSTGTIYIMRSHGHERNNLEKIFGNELTITMMMMMMSII